MFVFVFFIPKQKQPVGYLSVKTMLSIESNISNENTKKNKKKITDVCFCSIVAKHSIVFCTFSSRL